MEEIGSRVSKAHSKRRKLSESEIKEKLFYIYVYPFKDMIFSLCVRYSWDKNNIQDNYNCVLENFYKRVDTYNPEYSIRTWLHVVTKRCVIARETRLKKKNIERSVSQMTFSMDMDKVIDPEDESNTSNWVDRTNYRQFYSDDILRAMDSISKDKLSALMLQEAGYSLKEIVEIEHREGRLPSKCQNTVKSRIFFAKQQIREYLINNKCEVSIRYAKH